MHRHGVASIEIRFGTVPFRNRYDTLPFWSR